MIITDVTGRQYMKQSIAVRSGLNDYAFHLRNMAPGVYMVLVLDGGSTPRARLKR
jgi:hypothetical protein